MEKKKEINEYERRITRYENLKRGALARGNAVGYVNAINELGIPLEQIEDIYLYERGLAEIKYGKENNLEKITGLPLIPVPKQTKKRVSRMYEGLNAENCNKIYSWGNQLVGRNDMRSTQEKKRLLEEYLPDRFGLQSKYSLEDRAPKTINKIFDKIIQLYKK